MKIRHLTLSMVVALLAATFTATPLSAQSDADVTGSGVAHPSFPSEAEIAPDISPQQHEALFSQLLEKREKFAAEAQAKAGVADTGGAGQEALGPQTGVAGAAREAPGTLVIGRNLKNTLAEAAANSTLAEPAAINNRAQVLYAGNLRHIERSLNHGSTYAALSFPAGPADAPTVCCDNDMTQDDVTKIGFVSTLYVNAGLTNGVVRIFVRPAANLAATSCFYTIDPAGTGNNILPDYPHIALSRNFLYLSINALPTSGTGFARMYRFNLSQMRSCATTSFTTFTRSHSAGQRVWVPAGGAENQTFMDWVQHDTSTVMRIFHWPETAAAPTQVTRTLAASNFVNPDCRGGTGNFDFIERSTAWSIAGFRTRTVVARGTNQPTGFVQAFWHSAPTGGITQAHIRSAAFSLAGSPPGFGLLAQPHIFNQGFCFGYPAVTANILGDVGITLAFGGRAGGGGSAAQAAVGIDDNFTTSFGFGTVFLTAVGVANRSDGRFGDYYTIHRYQTCTRWFGAANYAWDSAPVDNPNDVNARWVEFGREAHLACYQAAQ
jgi:hypothetical protein